METLIQPPLDASFAATAASKTSPQLDDARDFVQTLAGWRDSNRGRLAQLKRNVGEPLPGRGVSWFYSVLYAGNAKRRLSYPDQHFLIATLFDLNRSTPDFGASNARSVGASMRLAVNAGANEESTGRRLQILLDADFEEGAASELAFRLRQTVQWLNGQKIGLDYAQTLLDLCSWSHPDRFVQKRWARDFYNVRPFDGGS